MALLGVLIDKLAGSFAGSNLVNSLSYASVIHSLPSTPDFCVVEMTSLATAGLVMPPPRLLVMGYNNSVVTMGIAQGSAVSQPVVAYNVIAVAAHSLFR